MTLNSVYRKLEAYTERRKEEIELMEHQSWLNGYFVMYAIASNFSKKVKYPKNPIKEEQAITDISGMSEDEIAEIHSNFLEKLDLMARTTLGK